MFNLEKMEGEHDGDLHIAQELSGNCWRVGDSYRGMPVNNSF